MLELEDIVATTNRTKNFLGHIFWFSIGKQMIEANELKSRLIDSGLDEAWLPNPIRVTDAFRRATREIQSKHPSDEIGIFKNYLVREVYSDNEIVQRNLVVETVDQEDKQLGYETELAILKLNKEHGIMSYEVMDTDLESLCIKAKEKFHLYKTNYSAQHLRVMVNKILYSLAPTPLRRNGTIYFIPKSMQYNLNKLVIFIQSLDNAEGYQVPVINSNENQEMISKSLQNHLRKLHEQCVDCHELTRGQLKALIDETNQAIKDYKEYQNLISYEQESFEKQIFNLRTEVLNLVNLYQN